MDKVRWARRVAGRPFRATWRPHPLRVRDRQHARLMPVELETLVSFGVSPRDALLAGTRWGAEACRIDDQIGTLVRASVPI